MTVDEVKEWLPIFQAVADGKVVQTLRYDGFWFDSDYCGIVIGLGASNYRIKPSENNAEKEEKTHSQTNFNIKQMKEFNLDEYLKNPSQKVVTRDGREVRIIYTDMKSDFPIIALIYNEDTEEIYTYRKNGRWLINQIAKYDLFFASIKKEGWTNVYKDKNGGVYLSGLIFESEKEAKETVNGNNHYVATIKIEWEE